MDRKKSPGSYMTSSGSAYGGGIRSKKKKKRGAGRILLYGALFILLCLFVGFGYKLIADSRGRTNVGSVTRVGLTLSQNVAPFGDSIIFYDGTTLHCMSASGSNSWSYQIGSGADYDVSADRVVAWAGSDLYILNRKGRLLFNDKMSDVIQFASVGEGYVAAFVGEQDNGVITVINNDGIIVDNITVEDQTLLDIGFFFATTTSSTTAAELMWVLGLDTTGTVISTELQTFQPGKLVTGKSSLGEHIAYRIYDVNGMLNVVDTRQIMHFNYRVLEQQSPTLIYGYMMEDVKTIGKKTYQLLVPAQDQSAGMRLNSVRLMDGEMDRVLHLPSECMATTLGTRSVYAFSTNAVYVCRYGESAFNAYSLPINITAVLGMIEGNRAIVASGSEIYVVELPE